MHLDSRASSSSSQYFTSVGGIMSLSDYNIDSKVTDCLKNGCAYAFSLNAILTSTQRILHIDIAYAGERSLQESIFLDDIRLNLNGEIYSLNIRIPIEIEGPKRISLSIPKPKENLNSLQQQEQ